MRKNEIGKIGEDEAVKFLKEKGYKIIQRNTRTRFSELDIVAIKDDTLVFIEVKTKTNLRKGEPYEEVTFSKFKRLQRGINYFLLNNPRYNSYKMRIDIISIFLNGGVPQIKHFKNVQLA